jgi:hypothetical protein
MEIRLPCHNHQCDVPWSHDVIFCNYSFVGKQRSSRSIQLGGKAAIIQARVAICQGKVTLARLLSMPRRIMKPALSTGIRNGMGKRLVAVIRVSTNPGQITVMPIPSFANAPRKPSPHTRTAALLAQ